MSAAAGSQGSKTKVPLFPGSEGMPSIAQLLGATHTLLALLLSTAALQQPRGKPRVDPSISMLPLLSQVLFVCLGNICRSPSAEAVFKSGAGVP